VRALLPIAILVLSACASSTPRPAGAIPVAGDVEAIPGRLRVTVGAVDCADPRGPGRCWTYRSHGLAALEHPELFVALRQRPGEAAPPSGVIALFKTIFEAVEAGQPKLWPWGAAGVGAPIVEGPADLVGFFAVAEGAMHEPGELTLVLLTRDELEIAAHQSVPRVAALLGQEYRSYPTVWWSDRDRGSVCGPAMLRGSLLAHPLDVLAGAGAVFDLAAPPTSAVPDGDTGLTMSSTTVEGRVVVRLTTHAGAVLAQELARSSLVAFLVNPDRTAGGRIVYGTGDTLHVITGPAATAGRLAGTFVAISELPNLRGARIVEDGFVISLAGPDRAALAAALADHRDLVVAGAGGALPWSIEWVRGGEEQDLLTQLVLVDSQKAFEEAMSIPDLVACAQAIGEVVVKMAAARPPRQARALTIEVTLSHDGLQAKVVTLPEEPAPWGEDLRALVEKVPPPPMVGGPLHIRLEYDLRP
jgi:hypothetical protein